MSGHGPTRKSISRRRLKLTAKGRIERAIAIESRGQQRGLRGVRQEGSRHPLAAADLDFLAAVGEPCQARGTDGRAGVSAVVNLKRYTEGG